MNNTKALEACRDALRLEFEFHFTCRAVDLDHPNKPVHNYTRSPVFKKVAMLAKGGRAGVSVAECLLFLRNNTADALIAAGVDVDASGFGNSMKQWFKERETFNKRKK